MKFFVSAAARVLLTMCLASAATAHAATTTIDPSQDGSLYLCNGCNPNPVLGGYLLTSGYIQGDERFSTSSITQPIGQALLSVNPYGLPLWGQTIEVYGYQAQTGQLSMSDATSGTLLGTWTLPSNLGYGQDAYFNVTGFLQNAKSPYVGFDLVTAQGGTDVFSSLEENYGHPSQLVVSMVPEPGTYGMFAAGLVMVGFTYRRRKPSSGQ